MKWDFPAAKRHRVIVNTDAKNEADDQFAIVHALLTPAFEIHGVIPAHFGDHKSKTSQRDSHDETMLLLDLLDLDEPVTVADGATQALPDETTAVLSAGAGLIVREANRDDDRPLHVLFYGPLTDMAAALLMDPGITQRNVHVVWIGGGPWPVGGSEYNLSNDIHAANVVFKSALEVSQIPQSVYRQMAVGYAELYEQVHPCGRLGAYLVEQLVEFNARRPMAMEYRSLGDSPAVGVVLNPACGVWEWRPAPEFAAGMNYLHTGANRPIRVYFSIDSRFIMEDMYAKLRAHTGN